MKLLIKVALLSGIAGLAACSSLGKHTTIVVNDNNNVTKIEYAGKITFNDARTAIENISAGGYVKYRHNDEKVLAKNDQNGNIAYELYDGSEQLPLDDKGKALIADAVKDIIKKSHVK